MTVLKRPPTDSQNHRNPSKNPNKQKKLAELKVHVNSGKQPKVAEREEEKKEEDKKHGNGKGAESTTGGTQHYRQHKERNKSSRANHNRKAGADRKRKAF